MTILVGVALALTAVIGTAVVLTTDIERQAVALSVYGIVLVVLFMALQAPDVALSQLAVGAAVVPLMVLLTWRKLQRARNEKQ